MTDTPHSELQTLRIDLVHLRHRVDALERLVAAPPAQPAPAVAARPAAPAPASPAAPRPPRPVAPVAPTQPARRKVDWTGVAGRLFTARTLAWAGGVATALGIVLLFALAASRGWVTPQMRVGLGVAVSLIVLAGALEADRRGWRADAILAAAGAGIAGLYASLWAATELFHMVSGAAASPLAALVAAIAVAVAIRIQQEPLAVFGVSGAMLAPVIVSLGVTASGVLFAAVMLAAVLPLYGRLRWQWLVAAACLIGFGEALALIRISFDDPGPGLPVAAAATVAGLLVAAALLVELLPGRRSLTPLGSLITASAFTLSLGDAFLYAGKRTADGHAVAGFTLLGVAVAWALVACVPAMLRRRHADLADLLAAYSLAAAATATGLLAGGPALVCAWSAESVALVGVAERVARRGGVRRIRLTIAAGVYLALAAAAAFGQTTPTPAHLPHVGAGAWEGSVALAAVALAGIVLCFGVRFVHPAQVWLWALPAVAIGYLPAWSLTPEQAVIAYAALAATLLGYRRSRLMVAWLDGDAAIAIAAGWWLAGAAIVLMLTAPLHDLVRVEWAGLGARDGLPGLAALAATACVLAWSVRRPARPWVELAALLPVAVAAYLVAEALAAPAAMWAWLLLAGLLAAAVHAHPVRRRAMTIPLLAGSAGMLALGTISAWEYDDSLQAIVLHGTTAGWQSIAIATAAALLLASALPDPLRRTQALWLPLLLAGQLAAMLLPGQYPLVAAAGLVAAVELAAIAWPAPIAARLHRGALGHIGMIGSLATAAVVLAGYETPRMLFHTSHTPAAGLAAALAVATALALAAIAARVQASPALAYLAGAAWLWTLAAAILGGFQLAVDAGAPAAVHDGFQQGHVAVSVAWVLAGLALVIASLRSRRGRGLLRVGGIALLFVALGKLFLYDLAFLTAMARAISFIVTGSVLLLAALLLQRFGYSTRAPASS